MTEHTVSFDFDKMQEALLAWYDEYGRKLPWRHAANMPDPYHIWMSEIMLQQTTVATVKTYYDKFKSLWPTIHDLAGASQDDVLHAWQGLGYYARARNLHKCAGVVVDQYNGSFPEDEKELLALPGIGPYTAAAIRSIAFNKPATVVDGNVERVISRVFRIETPLPDSKKEIKEKAELISSTTRPADYSAAIMDLGATICTPKSPKCDQCPWEKSCQVRADHVMTEYPKKKPKASRPHKHGLVHWVINDQNQICLRKRPETGLLASLIEVPWVEGKEDVYPYPSDWQSVPGFITHVFTHFKLDLRVAYTRSNQLPVNNGFWCDLDALDRYAFPTLMKKVIKHTLEHLEKR